MKPTLLMVEDIRKAKTELTNLGVHPAGVEIMALKAIFRLVKFEEVDPKTANIIKQEMLSRGGEVAVAETVGKFESQRTGMVIMGTLTQYIRLIRKLEKQSYGDCRDIGNDLKDLLFRDFDIGAAQVC